MEYMEYSDGEVALPLQILLGAKRADSELWQDFKEEYPYNIVNTDELVEIGHFVMEWILEQRRLDREGN